MAEYNHPEPRKNVFFASFDVFAATAPKAHEAFIMNQAGDLKAPCCTLLCSSTTSPDLTAIFFLVNRAHLACLFLRSSGSGLLCLASIG